MTPKLPKTNEGSVTAVRTRQEIQSRFNPIKNLTPARIVTLIEQFRRGEIRECAWTMEVMESQDDMLATVAPKRKKGLSRQDYNVAPVENWDSLGSKAQLKAQTEFLQEFYNNLQVTHALKRNIRGGVRKLIHQMADAIGKEYACHEIQWQPGRDGSLRATLTFVPLWFFEATTGELRFLETSGAQRGTALEPLRWMVTCGDGVMIASMVAYMFKHLPLKDLLVYSGRAGIPFVSKATDAQFGSAEWEGELESLKSIANEAAVLHSRGAELGINDLTVKGQLPMPILIERMDRALAMLWRGSDLSTMSGADRMGASLQQAESDILLEDDVDMVNETIDHHLTLPALRWKFGADVKQLAWFKLQSPDRLDEKAEQDKLNKAILAGVKVPVADYCERLSVPGAENHERGAYLVAPTSTEGTAALQSTLTSTMANAAPLDRDALLTLRTALAADFAEQIDHIDALRDADTPEDYYAALQSLALSLDEHKFDPENSALAQALEATLGTAVVDGAVAALQGK
ncbi:phage portal protein family protein [Coraliomargarita sp. W4R72]